MVFRLDGYTYGDPCPNCGNDERFGETCQAHGTLYTDSENDPKDFQMNQLGEALVVECLNCDTVLLDRLDH
jgi:hypothetical protein